jgi:hypothetical protein
MWMLSGERRCLGWGRGSFDPVALLSDVRYTIKAVDILDSAAST